MKLLGPWFFWVVPPTVFARAACHQKTIRRAVGALRCPPFTVCRAAQTKSLASPQRHATKIPWPSFLPAWPPNNKQQTPNYLLPSGLHWGAWEKRGNWVLCNKIWPSERKGETQGPFCVRFAWGPQFLASVLRPVWEAH